MQLTLTPIALPFNLGETVYLDQHHHDIDDNFFEGRRVEVTAIHPHIEPYRLGAEDKHFIKDNQLNLFVREITYRVMPLEGEFRSSIDYRYLILDNYQNKLKPIDQVNPEQLQLVMTPIEVPFTIGDTVYAQSKGIRDELNIESYKGKITGINLSSLRNTNLINKYNIDNQRNGQYSLAVGSVYYRVEPYPKYKVWKEDYDFIVYSGSFSESKALFSSEEELNQYLANRK